MFEYYYQNNKHTNIYICNRYMYTVILNSTLSSYVIQVDLRARFLFTLLLFIHMLIRIVVVVFFCRPFTRSSLFHRNHWTFSNAFQSTTTIRWAVTWIGQNINGPATFTIHKTMVAFWNIYTHTHTPINSMDKRETKIWTMTDAKKRIQNAFSYHMLKKPFWKSICNL